MRALLRATALLAALLGLGGRPDPAAAHPHVWITDVSTFVFEDRRLVALHHRWTFDELFGSFVIEQHDADGDGRFDAGETEALRAGAFDNLEEYGYFTHLRIDGGDLPLHQVRDFRASIEDGELIYAFTLPLPEPVDPTTSELVLGVYDPEYYVELLLDEDDPVRFAGLPSGACIYELGEDTEHPIYFGMVYPLTITLTCATS
jgi:ABC-type uncharacterized transport system substrate-binding protein